MDKVFSYPATIRGLGRLLVALAAFIWLILFIILLFGAPLGLFLFGTLAAAAFAALGLAAARIGSVQIELTQTGIGFTHGKKRRFVPYGDILRVSHTGAIYAAVVLHTASGRYTVGKNLTGYPDFAESLAARVPAMSPAQGDTLHIRCKAWEMYFCAVVFIVPSLAFWVIGLILTFRGEAGIGTAIVFSVVLLPFIAVLTVFSLRHPRSFDLTPDNIVQKSLLGSCEYAVSGIARVEYGQKKPKSGSRFGSATVHYIRLEFSNKKTLQIDNLTTNFPIEDVAAFVRSHWPVTGIYFETKLK